MKILGFIGLLIGGLLVYGFFIDHDFLRNVGLGGLIPAQEQKADDDKAAQAREAAIQANRNSGDGGGLVKCVDGRGNITFTQGACPGGSTGHSVKLNETKIVSLGVNKPANGDNGGGSSTSHPQSQTSSGQSLITAPEGHKENAQGALHDKYLPQ